MITRKFRFRGHRPLMQMIRAVICITPTQWLVAIVGGIILFPFRFSADVEDAIKQNVAFEDHRQIEYRRVGDRIAYFDSEIRKKCLKKVLQRITSSRPTGVDVRRNPQMKEAQEIDNVERVNS
jgi:hypothetical protein